MVVQELGFAFAFGHVREKLPTLRDFHHDLRLEQLSQVRLDVHELSFVDSASNDDIEMPSASFQSVRNQVDLPHLGSINSIHVPPTVRLRVKRL